MKPNEYQQLCARTECVQHNSLQRMKGSSPLALDHVMTNNVSLLTPIRLNHSLLGITGELGELAALFQKWIYYGKQFDRQELIKNIGEEFGDILWFVCEGLNAVGLNLEDVMTANIEKLRARYPDKYTDQACANQNRNLKAENEALVKILSEAKDVTQPPQCKRKEEGILSDPDFVPPVMDYECEQDGKPNLSADEVARLYSEAGKVAAELVQDGHGFGHADKGEVNTESE